MTAVLLAGAVVTLSVVAIRLQRSTDMPVVLRLLPAALLFLTIPAAGSGYAILHGFREVGVSGSSEQIPAVLHAACTAMWWGSIGLLATVAAAAIVKTADVGTTTSVTLQIADSAPPAVVEPPDVRAVPVRRASRAAQWPLLLAPVALIPAVLVALLIADISAMVMRAKTVLAARTEVAQIAGMELSEVSAWVSNRILLAIGVGGLASLLLVLLALLNMLPVRHSLPGRGTIRYGRTVGAITAAAAVWLAVRFSIALSAIERIN